MDAPETAAPPHAALHPRNAGNSLYPSAGRLTRNLPFPPVAYIALALEAEEMISRSHAIPCIKNKSAKLDEILAAQKKLQTDITNKQAEIEQNQKDLAAAQEKQQEQYDAMKKRIQFMYENSAEDNIWTAIIESNGITDMLNRIEYVSDVYDSDRALMDSYQAAVEQVNTV